jgi:hypothetical protein
VSGIEDIAGVSVVSDDSGTITFLILARTSPGCEGGCGSSYRIVSIETNTARYQIAPTDDSYALFRWSERQETYKRVAEVAGGDGAFSFSLDRHLLGDADNFRFAVQNWAYTCCTIPGSVNYDSAPDHGWWEFPVRLDLRHIRPVLALREGNTGHSPTLRATLALHVRGSASGRLLASGKIECAARRAAGRFHCSVEGSSRLPVAGPARRCRPWPDRRPCNGGPALSRTASLPGLRQLTASRRRATVSS